MAGWNEVEPRSQTEPSLPVWPPGASFNAPPDPGEAGVTWSTGDAIVVLVLAFLVYVVGSFIVGIVDLVAGGSLSGHQLTHYHVGFWVLPVSYLFLTTATFLLARWLIVGRHNASWSALGFRLPPIARGSWAVAIPVLLGAALAGLICVYVGEGVIIGIFKSFSSFHIKGNAKELLPSGQSHLNVAQYLTLVIVAAILAPITEETLFRGILFQGLRRDLSFTGATPAIILGAIGSGTLFGLFHLIGGTNEVYTLPILIYLGIVLAVVFQIVHSLPGSMLVHASVNFVSITFLFAQHH